MDFTVPTSKAEYAYEGMRILRERESILSGEGSSPV